MDLQNKHVVILVEQDYEDMELWYPLLRMREAGASVMVVGPEAGKTYPSKHGYPVVSGASPHDIDLDKVDALIIPGGYAPDHMRRDGSMVALVRAVNEKGGIIAFICHGGWMPASAKIVTGRKLTSFFAIRDDLEHAGAEWVDQAVVRDGNFISSRMPDDLPDFCRELIAALSE
jgi:protease I